jgi:rubrerythrin
MKRILAGILGAVLAVALFVLVVPPAPLRAADAPATTLDNLQAAYNGESNAQVRYQAFAKKADEEGWLGVASLFRAAAHSEGVHVARLAEVIKKMGGVPKADIQAPEVKTTKENLEAALKGESHERDAMYPGFIKQARAERNTDALRVFNFAKSAETEHAKFYQAALAGMESWKAAKKTYFVCNHCGFTVEAVTFDKCPVCFEPKSEYIQVD